MCGERNVLIGALRLIIVCLSGTLALQYASPASTLSILPPVKESRQTGEVLRFDGTIRIETTNRFLAGLLREEMNLYPPQQRRNGRQAARILIGLANQRSVAKELAKRNLPDAVPTARESYLISVTSRGALLTARDDAGLFYAVQTVRQLIRRERDKFTLPECLIRDWPGMEFRGLSVDLGQGAVPTEAQIRRIITICSEYKLNVVSLYMQHVVPFASTPLLTPKGAEIDIETLKRLVAHAARRHVTLLPQQQTFGHMHHLLKHEIYSHLGEMPHGTTLTAGDPAVYRWIDGMLSELVPVFPGPFFHAGGDETWDLGKGINKDAYAAEGGPGRLWTDHMSRVAGMLRQKNRRMLVWGDRLLKAPEAISRMPKDTIIATWNYNAKDDSNAFIAPFRKAGLDVVVCPSVNNWSKPAPDFHVATKNIGAMVAEGKREGALGMLNTVWFDDGESLFDMVWHPVVYSAACAWEGGESSSEQFAKSFDWSFYRNEGHGAAESIRRLSDVHEAARKAGLPDAANEYLWLDPFKGRGAKIYARLATQAASIRRLSEEALTILFTNKANCRLHRETLDYLEFAARRFDWLGMRAQFSCDMTSFYNDARANQTETRRVNYAFLNMSAVNGRVQDLRDMAGEMKEHYRQLWLAAHRPYMLSSMLALYDRELLFWIQKADQFEEARILYRQTKELPPASFIGLAER
jgi:hypothetical protein